MARNPLFACVRGNKYSYNPNKSEELLTNQLCKPVSVLSVRQLSCNSQQTNHFFKMSDKDQPPAPKRRKTEETGDDWDDDDFNLQLSQADFDQIENLTSKSVGRPHQGSAQPKHGATSTSRTGKPGPGVAPSSDPGRSRLATGAYSKPKISSAPPSLNTSAANSSFLKPTPLNRSTSSSSSVSNGVSSDNYPSGLSSYSSKSSSSIRSLSSEEIPYVGTFRPQSLGSTQQASEAMDTVASFVSTPVTVAMQAEIDKYKKDYNAVKSQLKKAQEDMCCKEGEIKILRQKLREKEGEINVAKEEKIRTLERHNKEQSEHEKSLKDKLEKLNTQLQFKEQDIVELKGRCQQLEARIQSAGGDAPTSSPYKSSQRPGTVSPKVIKVERSPKGKSTFPTQHSFMADDRSPGKPRSAEQKITRDATTMTQLNERAVPDSQRRCRQFSVVSDTPGGRVTGAQLIASLVDTGSESGVDRGIVGLLQTQATVLDIQALQFDRDTSSNLLSPVHNRRLLEMKTSLTTEKKGEAKPVSSPEHHTLALQALQQMLRDTDCVRRSAIPHSSTSTLHCDRLPSTSGVCSVKTLSENSAISFLPLLDDYLFQYLDMLSCAVDKTSVGTSPPSSSSSSKASSSMDSSLESLTSSLNILLKDCVAYANNLETLAFIALKILLKLVSNCDCVREVLLTGECSSVEKIQAGPSYMDTDQQGPKSDPDSSDTSLPSTFTKQKVIDLAILKKIFRLANPGQSGHRYNTHVVERALDILTVLCDNLEEDHVDSLLPVLSDGVLINCLECDVDPSIILRGMKLMTSLVKFNPFVSQLCVCPDGCLLSVLYQTSTCNLENFSNEQIQLCSEQMIVCVHNIVSIHKGGIMVLLLSNCRCSMLVVKSVVLVVHRLLQMYESLKTNDILPVLKHGLLLLHLLFSRDDHFSEHRYPVEHQYVRLVCGLTTVFKHLPNSEHEMNALSDLWDFDQDDSEFSQESEDEDGALMDTS